MDAGQSRWDDRSAEQWLEQAVRFEKMAERFQHHPGLNASFSALARDAVVRAKDGRPSEARVLAAADLRRPIPSCRAAQTTSSDVDYFRRREAQERLAAVHSADSRARRAHLEMAHRYHAILSDAEEARGAAPRLVS
jgi:hypothetical protein